jgi:hypothetical protein
MEWSNCGSQIVGCERKLGETRKYFIGLKKRFGYEQKIGFLHMHKEKLFDTAIRA